jgi:hypothetical protein
LITSGHTEIQIYRLNKASSTKTISLSEHRRSCVLKRRLQNLWATILLRAFGQQQKQLQGHDCSAKCYDKDCDTKKTWWDGNAENDGAKQSQV